MLCQSNERDAPRCTDRQAMQGETNSLKGVRLYAETCLEVSFSNSSFHRSRQQGVDAYCGVYASHVKQMSDQSLSEMYCQAG